MITFRGNAIILFHTKLMSPGEILQRMYVAANSNMPMGGVA